MALDLSVTIPNLEAFKNKFDDETVITEPYRRGLTKLMLVIEGKARTYAKPHSGDRGELARAMRSEIRGSGIRLSARVFNNKLYAAPAEYGRRPGRMPPVGPISDWLRRHGEDPARGYIVARAIGRRGTRGIFFMKQAAADGRKAAPAVFAQVATDIEKAWRDR